MIAWIAGRVASLVIPGYAKYVAIAIAASFAYWFVWDTGRGFERERWETKMAQEISRQQTIIDAAQVASQVAAELLLSSEDQRTALVRRLQNAARTSPDADACGLGASSVMRLNSLSSNPETP